MKIHHAHDLVFKSALSDLRVAKDFLSHYLPANVQSRIDLDTLKLCSSAFISPELRALNADLVFSVELLSQKSESTKNSHALFYFHLEEQTEPEPFMAWRMIKYAVPMIERYLSETHSKTLPIIIPIVVYSGKKPYPYSVDVFDLFGEHQDIAQEWMFNKFKLIDLSAISDETLKSHQWSGLLEMLLKHIHNANIMEKIEALSSVFQTIVDADEYLMTMIRYILAKAELKDKTEFFNWAKKTLPKKLEKASMTIAEQLRQEGMQQGIQQGMQQGIQQGIQHEKDLLVRLMTRRFSAVPRKYLDRLEHYDPDALLAVGEKILDAKTIDEIFED